MHSFFDESVTRCDIVLYFFQFTMSCDYVWYLFATFLSSISHTFLINLPFMWSLVPYFFFLFTISFKPKYQFFLRSSKCLSSISFHFSSLLSLLSHCAIRCSPVNTSKIDHLHFCLFFKAVRKLSKTQHNFFPSHKKFTLTMLHCLFDNHATGLRLSVNHYWSEKGNYQTNGKM